MTLDGAPMMAAFARAASRVAQFQALAGKAVPVPVKIDSGKVAAALAGVQAKLQGLAGKTIPLQVDRGQLAAGLRQAREGIAEFQNAAKQLRGAVTIDTSKISKPLAEAKAQLAAIAKTTTAALALKIEKFTAPLSDAKARLQGVAKITTATLFAKTAAFTASIVAARATLNSFAKTATVSVSANIARFTAPIAAARATLAKTATVHVAANIARFTVPIAEAKARLQTLAKTTTASVVANTTRFFAPLAPVKNALAQIARGVATSIRVDPGAATGALASMRKALGTIGSAGGKVSSSISLNTAPLQAGVARAKALLRSAAAKVSAVASLNSAPLAAGIARAKAMLAGLKRFTPTLSPGVNFGSITSGVRRVSGGVSGALSGIGGALGKVLGPLALVGVGFAAFKSIEGFVGKFKEVAETGKELRAMSSITGTSVRDLVVLRKAFDQVGIGADSVQANLVRMQRSLGGVNEEGAPTKYIFDQLGLSIEKLQTMSSTAQLDAISKAIAKLPNQSQRAAAAMGIFGRAGAEMLAFFANPDALKEAGAAVGDQAAIYERSAARFAKFTNTLQSLSSKVKGFFVGFADQVTPVILPMLEKLKKSMNFVEVGQRVGRMVGMIGAAFKGDELGALLGLSLEKAAMGFGNALMGVVTGTGAALGAIWSLEFDAIKAMFSNMGGVWTSLKHGLVGAIQTAGAMLLQVFQKPIMVMQAGLEYAIEKAKEKMGQIPGLGKLTGLTGFKAPEFQSIYKEHEDAGGNLFGSGVAEMAANASKNFEIARGQLKNIFADVDFKGEVTQIIEAWKDGFAKGKVLDTADVEARLNALQKKLQDAAGKVASETTKSQVGGPGLLGADVKDEKIKTPTNIGDRLAKIGLFIGGGGPAGQKHAQETARNTMQMKALLQKSVEYQQQLIGLFGRDRAAAF